MGIRLLIRMPDFVTAKDMEAAQLIVTDRKGIQKAAEIEWHTLEEGKCVQMLHVGPFSTEPESLKIMSAFMDIHQFAKNGLHHEIYLSDFRKTAPEKLKTILREPVR
ncbi:GyrI-like domain-containing protein [Niabella hibiscisoli]|uniref:GyrI-like domain-containing protein n=1 Tax=Niabella hibiscisoli TaxID=1825928 RepID=UPI0021D43D10|nr:GyrI-like domain-containing protein [Niabella hibiscisoli]